MIIHCLSCGKSISSHGHNCPYCMSEVSAVTRELNGIQEKLSFAEKIKQLAFGLTHKGAEYD